MKKIIRNLFLFSLSLILCFALLTGCSKKATMFSTMKEASKITSTKINATIDLTTTATDETSKMSFTLTGSSNNKNAAFDLAMTTDGETYTLTDFVRLTNDTVYLNCNAITQAMSSSIFLPDSILGEKKWISIPTKSMNDETLTAYQTLSDSFIDAFEEACKEQHITQKDDTFTLDIPKDKAASFTKSLLEVINTNISSWYDSYVNIMEKSDMDDLLKEYNALLGVSTDDQTSMIQELKEQKAETLKSWDDFYKSAIKEDTTSTEEIASANYSISLTGKEGSRTCTQKLSCDAKDKDSSFTLGISSTTEETNDIKIEAPAAAECITLSELSALLEQFYSSYNDTSGTNADDELEDESLSTLSEDDKTTINNNLKDNQIYIYSSSESTLTPYLISYDTTLMSNNEKNADTYTNFDLVGKKDSFLSLYYSAGKANDMLTYYLEDGQKLKTLTTDLGEISYIYTEDEEGSASIDFGIQTDANGYLLGSLMLDKQTKGSFETYLKGLTALTPYQKS